MARKQRATVAAHDLRSVYNGSGNTIPKGAILTLVNSGDIVGEIELANSTTRAFYGIAYEPIPPFDRGTAQIRGIGLILLGEDALIGDRIISDDNGAAAFAPENVINMGRMIDQGSTGDLVECEINGPSESTLVQSQGLAWRIVPIGRSRVIPSEYDLVISDIDIQAGAVLDIELDGRLVFA